ncbi:LytTR family two component transcriptional regulator [Algoriphagus aquaeductus]|uniref:LytTR family two component transcriptional regulator n=1 Tax=Algoriphagus aquaeductus TaxID=475299 RepID=A0A326S0S1_9BACT|nr:LytTR family DNA-binding domain-containing protein [Algoriphagus aquaeductus]PZV83186.1 LytTR family two component transcriptional regulator [Algoriphagus aquaeductus]
MSKKRVYLVDDELLALEELKVLLNPYEDLEIIGANDRVEEAILECNELMPDLIFLDINMPGKDGFAFLESLEEVKDVIFVTAYDQFAIKAFEINALDYLLKPLNPKRLAEAIQRFRSKVFSNPATPQEDDRLSADKKIFIKDGEKCHFVPIAKIFLLESEGNYVRVYYDKHKPLLHKSLTYLEQKLPDDLFFRANRQYMFNLDFIDQIEPYFNSTLLIILKSGHKIDLSQRQSAKFREITGV